jgi:hypothetical protein
LWRKREWFNLRNCFGICPKELKWLAMNISQGDRCPTEILVSYFSRKKNPETLRPDPKCSIHWTYLATPVLN